VSALKWESVSLYQEREAALKAQIEDLQRQLDNARTDWLCDTCNGRGCEAENQNTILLAELEKLQREKALQGLHLATMADVVLGENAEDRSDETLVREVCKMAREHAARKEKPCQS